MLWTCLLFHRLPLEVFERGSADARPLLVTSLGNRPWIVAANAAAIQQGIQPGMNIGAALVLIPDALIQQRSVEDEQQALVNLAVWAEQFTPTRSVVSPMAVLLEIGGCLGYFGGLDVLLGQLRPGITELGYAPIIATAPTPTAALLLARAGRRVNVLDPTTAVGELMTVPLHCIDHSAKAIAALRATGARTIGDCLRLPRDGVARRYGQALLDIIGRALGDIPDPQVPFVSPEFYAGRLAMPCPVWDAEALLFAIHRLQQEMCGWLRGRYRGVMRLQLELIHEDTTPTFLTLNLSAPTRQPDDLCLLWRERLARLTLPDRVEAIALSTLETRPLNSRDLSLLPGAQKGHDESASLMDRLRSRLGDDAVTTLQPHPDHRPERAWSEGDRVVSDHLSPDAPRPIWLLPEPRALEPNSFTSGKHGPWVLMDGPETLEAGWWDGGDMSRDYYVVRNPHGQTLWIYRDRQADRKWFVHGLFA